MKTQLFFWTAQQELRTIMNFGGRSLFVQKIYKGVLAAFNVLFKVVFLIHLFIWLHWVLVVAGGI